MRTLRQLLGVKNIARLVTQFLNQLSHSPKHVSNLTDASEEVCKKMSSC
jgi:hypothetical protein